MGQKALKTNTKTTRNHELSFLFQTILENYTFVPFSFFLAIFWVFMYMKVPETKKKTFEEIATLFKN